MNETRQQKLEYLTDNGYLHNLRGELGMSTKTLSLLTKLPEDTFTTFIPDDMEDGTTGTVNISRTWKTGCLSATRQRSCRTPEPPSGKNSCASGWPTITGFSNPVALGGQQQSIALRVIS